MPIDRITFSTSYEHVNRIGLRSWKKFGAEYRLMDGEDIELAKKELKDFVYESLKKQTEELPEEKAIQIGNSEDISTEQKIINQINDCSDITVLKSFELLAKNNPKIKEAYTNKYNSLTNNTPVTR